MSSPPFNMAAVELATLHALQIGKPILQTHYYAPNDQDHVAKLLDWLRPDFGAVVIDAGSGLGEVARIMGDMRKDLAFLLVNLSPLQLALGQEEDGERFCHLVANCEDMKGQVPDSFAQAIMFSSAICQMDTAKALAEAFRVLDAGGVLLINDMVRTDDNTRDMEEALAARVMQLEQLTQLVEQAGFKIDFAIIPDGDDAHFKEMLAVAGVDDLLENVFPVVIRATKGGTL